MHRIDTKTAQKDEFGAGKNGFTCDNPQTGTSATDLDDDYLDMLQEELCSVVEASGASLEKGRYDQLLTALRALLLGHKNPFGDIRSDDTMETAPENLGLGGAARWNVSTGGNQIPDMEAFASGPRWFRLPGGYIVQLDTFSRNTIRLISRHFPIPFPNQPMVSVSVMSDAVQLDPSDPTLQVLSVNFEHISNSAWRVATSNISRQYRFSYISIKW